MKYTDESIIILDTIHDFAEAWLVATDSPDATATPLFMNHTTTRKRLRELEEDTGYDNTNYLTVLDGWINYVGLELVTVPKLNGPGSYIESKHVSEREITLTTSVSDSDAEDVEVIVNDLLAVALPMNPVNVFRVLSVDSVVRRIELLEGYIGGVSEWDKMENDATLTFSVRCMEPVKLYQEYAEDNSGTVTKTGEQL
jgi:hypothetical protein